MGPPLPAILPNRTVRICVARAGSGAPETEKRFIKKTTRNVWEYRFARRIAKAPVRILPQVYRAIAHGDRYTIFTEFLTGDPVRYPPPELAAHIIHAFSDHCAAILPPDWRRPPHYAPLFRDDFLSRATAGDPDGAREMLKEMTAQRRIIHHNDVRERNFLTRDDGSYALIDCEMASENLVGAEFHHSALLVSERPDHAIWHDRAIE